MTTLIVDADGLAYEAAAAVQVGIAWDDDIYTLHADLNEAKEVFATKINKLIEATDAKSRVILCYSCPTRRYFRHNILPTYKANRKGTPPPLVLKALKEWTCEEYETKTKSGLEADDVVGILATHPKLIRGEKIVVSSDKDLEQIPGLHLNANDPSQGVYQVSPERAERALWRQVLTGDQADGYSGLPTIGPIRAERILDDEKLGDDYVSRVLAAYERAGFTKEDMAVQVNVARILQAQWYDFKRKEPILWKA